MAFDAVHKQPAIRAQQQKAQQQSLTSTDQVVSPALPSKPVAMVSATLREEEEPQSKRINIGSNLSQVQRALKSKAFQPLPPAGKEEYEEVVDKSVKYAEFKPLSLAEREALSESSSKYRKASAGFKPHKTDEYQEGLTPLKYGEWWESTEGRSTNRNPGLMKKEDDVNFHPKNNGKQKDMDKISTSHRKTGKVRPKKEAQAQKSEQKRKNPIRDAILWASDVSNPDAPNLRETGQIAARQVKEFGKKTIPVIKKAAKEGLHAAKWGVRAVGEVAEEFEKTPMARNILKNAESEYSYMRSAGRRTRESIEANGKKRHITASSLNKPKTFYTTSNPYGIIGKYERGAGGRTELHFYRGTTRLTHAQVEKVLTHRQVQNIKKSAVLGQNTFQYQEKKHQAPQAVAQNATPVLNQPNSPSGLAKKRVETHSGLIKKRVQGNPIGQGIRASAPFAVIKKPIVL